MNAYKKRSIVLINEQTDERVDMVSINAAASFLGTTFSNVQRTAIYNGAIKGWRVYESAEAIRQHIADLKAQLKIVEE